MSVMNKALSGMTEKKSGTQTPLEKAEIAPVSAGGNKLVWVGVGVLLSLGVGAWAITGEEPEQQVSQVSQTVVTEPVQAEETVVVAQPVEEIAPTRQSAAQSVAQIYQPEPVVTEKTPQPRSVAKTPAPAEPKVVKQKPRDEKRVAPIQPAPKVAKAEPVKAKSAPAPKPKAPKPPAQPEQVEQGSMAVQQVELTHEQLAAKAAARAQKALDASDLGRAISEYKNALKYTPHDEVIRKKLAALYYGRGDVRRAVDTLNKGVELDPDSQSLRLALVNVLVKENLPEVALGVVEPLPPQPGTDYLAARAGLAQKVKNSELALESYHLLAELDESNAKWWLGLGIEQERAKQLEQAKASYTKALNRVGLSSKTHTFIRSRLTIIQQQQEAQANAN